MIDPDVRALLANTKLDINKAEVFQDKKLRLITSVVYSERFEVKGNRMKEVFYHLI